MYHPPQNKTDRVTNDFFHSKVWKTISTCLLSMIGTIILIIGCMAMLLLFGVGLPIVSGIRAMWKEIPTGPSALDPGYKLAFATGTSTIEPTREMVPTEWPTVTLASSTSDVWFWNSLELYKLKVQLPLGWSVYEIDRRPTSQSAVVDHECADYLIASDDGINIIMLKMPCEVESGESYICPEGTLFINDLALRVPDLANNAYSYQEGESDENHICWTRSIWPVGNNFVHIRYSRTDMNYGSITDFTIPDRIILSLREK